MMIRMQRVPTPLCVPGIRGSSAAFAAALIILSAAALARTPAEAQNEPTMLEEVIEPPYALTAGLHITDPASVHLRIVLDYTDPGSTYAITCTPGETIVERITGGTATRIGRSRAFGAFEADSTLELTVRRDAWRIVFILDRQVLAEAWDSGLSGGAVGYSATGAEVTDPMMQPLGEIYMTDDFMRGETDVSTWESISGTWQTQSLRVDEQSDRMEADKSANAFSFWGKADEAGPAVASTGYWFWNNYQLTSAVRAADADPLGLIAYFQDPENYILARWTSALSPDPDANLLQLIAVRNGQRSVLGESPGGHLPGQWYRFQLRVCDGVMQCLVDDEPRLVAQATLFGQGQPGLYCEGTGGVFFDSVAVEDWEVLSDDFSQPEPGKWVTRSGDWKQDGGRMLSGGTGSCLAVTGLDGWHDYWVSADVDCTGAAGIALCVGDSSWYALRFGTRGSGVAYEGQAQIVRVSAGDMQVLSTAPAHIAAGSRHQFRASANEGLITGYLDGKRVLDAYDPGARTGRIGLFADGKGSVGFDNVYLAMIPPKRIARVTKEFTEGEEHFEMQEWASTRAPWLQPTEEGGAFWTKGDYFGDKTIEFEVPGVGAADGSVRLTLEGQPGEETSGITLVLSTVKGSKTLTATLVAGSEQLGEQAVEVTSDPVPVRFERKGTWVVASVDGNVVFNVKR